MRRHTEAGEHPEATTPANAYGSAIHDAISHAEEAGVDDAAAIQAAFDKHAVWLGPEHLIRMKEDMHTYRHRDYTGVRTVAVEKEVKVPLFVHDGTTVYFRAKLDRLYQRRDNPGVFIHIDYKSSQHPLRDAEVHSDIQMWAYNWLIHEFWPECDTLIQVYDQLSFGAVPTRKSPEQRQQIKDWLIAEVTAILNDDQLDPKLNDWCAWCAIAESCPIVKQATEWTQAKIDSLGPVGEASPYLLEGYVSQLEQVGQARKVLERYERSVREHLKTLPQDRRLALGYELRDRKATSWNAESLRAVHELLGDEFYDVVGMTKSAIERHPQATAVLGMAEETKGTQVIQKVRTA